MLNKWIKISNNIQYFWFAANHNKWKAKKTKWITIFFGLNHRYSSERRELLFSVQTIFFYLCDQKPNYIAKTNNPSAFFFVRIFRCSIPAPNFISLFLIFFDCKWNVHYNLDTICALSVSGKSDVFFLDFV